MTKRTRLFVLSAAGILVVGLGTGLVASYMGGFQNFVVIGSDGPDELAYLPDDARLVAFANVREVMDSELRQKLEELHPRGGADRFQEETGIDVATDIDRVIAALSDSESEAERPLIIARGRFDEVRIEGLIRQKGGSVEEYSGMRLLTHPDGNIGISFVEPGLVAVGSPASVRRALDTKAGRLANVTTNAELMRFVRDVSDGNAWTVARFDALAGRGQLTSDLANQLPAINWLTARGYVNGGVRGTVSAETRDEAAAQDLRDVIQGFMVLARMQAGQNPELTDLINSLQLGGSGTVVSLAFSVPVSVLDTLGAFTAPRFRERGQDPDGLARPSLPPPARTPERPAPSL